MDHTPAFRFLPSTSHLVLRPSSAAAKLAKAYRRRSQKAAASFAVKLPERVREEAVARVQAAGGDPSCSELVLSETELQFGQYRGRTLKWLLSNDVGYAVSIIVSHQGEGDGGGNSHSPLNTNIDALTSYAELFPSVIQAVKECRTRDGYETVRVLDNDIIGFGVHAGRTYASLYEATDSESKTYVQWLKHQSPGAGSRMAPLKVYLVGRASEEAWAAATLTGYAGAATLPAHESTAHPLTSTGSGDVSDDVLVAADVEVDSQLARDNAAAPDALPGPPPPTQLTQPLSTGAELLPEEWRKLLPVEQQDWLGRALFTRDAGGHPVLVSDLRLWWNPPGNMPLHTQPPVSWHPFFHARFFLWMPNRMWACQIVCGSCGHNLTGAGLYRTVRRVLDMTGWYFMGTEYLECLSCKRKCTSWSEEVIAQLDLGQRMQFPAVLTYKLSCDKVVVGLLRECTLGSGVARLRDELREHHTTEWVGRVVRYLSVLKQLGVRDKQQLPSMQPVPSVSSLRSVYVQDALCRLPVTKASITSVFGSILKMDSTKKMTKKLAGEAAGSAAWVTNVGNEHGQVLISVLTACEGDGLLPLAQGLIRRYREAGVAPPQVLYVDRDCCALDQQPKIAAMFGEWDQLVVRMDVWHLMQRFARGVTTDAHLLYGPFISRLSLAIFEWDRGDLERLKTAKQAEAGVRALIRPTMKEMARHCRRRIRAQPEVDRLIQEVLDHFWDAKDRMGVPLIDKARMTEIWRTQRRHLHCIQDPEGVQLYIKTGEVTRGRVKLPVFRCARGSCSLESFHRHLCRFVPGTSASDLHFQVYLLEGLDRWNKNRPRASVQGAQRTMLPSHGYRVDHMLDQLTSDHACVFSGELIGLEYLYSQTGAVLPQNVGEDPDTPDGLDEEEEEVEEEEQGLQEEGEDEGSAEGDLAFWREIVDLLQPAAGNNT